MSGDQFVLVDRQTFRCQWSRIERQPGVERHLLVNEALHGHLDLDDLALGLTAVHPLTRVDVDSAAGTIAQLSRRGAGPAAIATDDEYLLGVGARLQKSQGLDGPRPADVAVFTDNMAMKEAVHRAG